MVDVIIKGTTRERTFEIATIKAGISLKGDGGIYLQLSSKPLSKAFQELFKNMKRDKHGFYK